MKKNCDEIDRSKRQEEFNKCLENLKVQVAKTDKICGNDNQPKPPAAKEPIEMKKEKDQSEIKKEKDRSEIKKEKDQASDAEEDSIQIPYGIRVNFSIPKLYPGTLKTNERDIPLKSGIGGGFSFFVFASFGFFDFVPEISIQHREAVKTNNLNITETAVEMPLMFRFLYSEDNLIYFGVGAFIGAVFNLIEAPTVADGRKGMKDFRSAKDYGAVLELGFRINNNLSADIRGTASLNPFGIEKYLNANNAPSLMQAQIGVSYLFR